MNIYTRSHSGNTFEPGRSANTAHVPGYARAKGLPPSGLIVTLKRSVSAAPHSQVRARIASRPAKMRGEESACAVRKGGREGVLDEKLSGDIPVACQVEVLQRKSGCDGRGCLKQVYASGPSVNPALLMPSFPFRPLTRRSAGQQGELTVEAYTKIANTLSTSVNTRILPHSLILSDVEGREFRPPKCHLKPRRVVV